VREPETTVRGPGNSGDSGDAGAGKGPVQKPRFLEHSAEPLSKWTTFGVGGPAESFVEVPDTGLLVRLVEEADQQGTPVLLLGEGSNMLISDEGFPGVVLRVCTTGREASKDGEAVVISVAAGERWAPFVQECVAEGLSGIECLAGIPGLVGATPVQNVGAYGEDVEQTVQKVTIWDRAAKRLREMSAADCKFAYRTSVFKRNDRYVVTNVTFRLQRSRMSQPLRYSELCSKLGTELGDRAPLQDTASAVFELRRSKGMVIDPTDPDTRSAGSFFTNPVLGPAAMDRLRRRAPAVPSYPAGGGERVPAGWLVEQAGFSRGYTRGGSAISTKHALALVCRGGGNARDVIALAREVRDRVQARFGVLLEPEPVLIGLHL